MMVWNAIGGGTYVWLSVYSDTVLSILFTSTGKPILNSKNEEEAMYDFHRPKVRNGKKYSVLNNHLLRRASKQKRAASFCIL